MKIPFTFLLCFSCLLCISQNDGLMNYDHIYMDNIKSVQFYPGNDLVGLPVLYIGPSVPLVLAFDDVSGEEYVNYVYTVTHCDKDWQPSRLTELEYIEGFPENNIREYDYSYKAKSIYTHYWFSFPNDDISFTKSGNYLLHVFEEDEMAPVLTRRFVVVDTKVEIVPKMTRPAVVSKINTHQEIDFSVLHEGFEIRNPQQELTAVILQNNRWDNAITDVKPLFSRLAEQRFDYQNKIVFPAGKEFRFLDLRGVVYPSPRVSVTEKDKKYEATLERDKKRGRMAHYEWYDLNGSFIIENRDERGRIFIDRSLNVNPSLPPGVEREFNIRLAGATSEEERDEINQDRQILIQNRLVEEQARQLRIFGADNAVNDVNNLQGEYVDVLFSLYSPGEMYDEEIYIFGALSDWEFKPEFKMVFNPIINAYVGKVRLKQGYYDYIYAALPKGGTEPDFEVTEGNWHETENSYTILLYYRPFGSRYDQLIGYSTFSSRF